MKAGIRTKNGRSFTRFSIRELLGKSGSSDGGFRRLGEYFDRAGTEVSSSKGGFRRPSWNAGHNRDPPGKRKKTEFLTAEWIAAVGQHPVSSPGAAGFRCRKNLKEKMVPSLLKAQGL